MVTAAVSGPWVWSPGWDVGKRDCSVGPAVGLRLATLQPGVFVPVAEAVGDAGSRVSGGCVGGRLDAVGPAAGWAVQPASQSSKPSRGSMGLLNILFSDPDRIPYFTSEPGTAFAPALALFLW